MGNFFFANFSELLNFSSLSTLESKVPCVTTTISFNSYYALHFFRVHNNNCSIYNRDLQTTIILCTTKVSSHKTDWILSEFPLLALYFTLQSKLFNECTWRRISVPSRNLYKCKLVIVIFVFFLRCPWSVIVACLLVYSVFCVLMLLLPVYFIIPFLYWCCCYIVRFHLTRGICSNKSQH